MRVGVVSDTHGVFHRRLAEVFAGCDHILHAGDIGDVTILDRLREIAPVTAVAGNIDGFVCGDAVEEASVELNGSIFYLVHILDRPSAPRPEVAAAITRLGADVVIFGHSHLPHDEARGGVHYFNPASAGPRRFDYPVSVGIFESDNDGWKSRHVALDERSEAALPKHMNQLSRSRG